MWHQLTHMATKKKPVKWTEVQDDSCHHYVIPFDKLSNWHEWLEEIQDMDYSGDWDPPEYAHRIDGGCLVFEKWSIE
jgi:hypothetical protein